MNDGACALMIICDGDVQLLLLPTLLLLLQGCHLHACHARVYRYSV
jgi:hypothetical protein